LTTVGPEKARPVTKCLMGFAWLMSGSTSTQGPYAENIKKTTGYIINMKTRAQSISRSGNQYNWDCAFALMYLSQITVLGEGDQKVADKIAELIEDCRASQYPNGGWTHGYMGKNPLDYETLLAVTSMMLNGLTMIKQAGIKVPQSMLDKGFDYVKKPVRRRYLDSGVDTTLDTPDLESTDPASLPPMA